MKKLLICLLLVCSCAFGQAGYYSPYDPGAARSDLSNVEAASDLSINSLTLADKVQAAWADILGNVYASGSAIVGAGTAAAPAYTTTGDTNTGIYFPAADTIGFSEGGAEAARITSGGEVLINTTTDAGDYKLQVNGNVLSSIDSNSLLAHTISNTNSGASAISRLSLVNASGSAVIQAISPNFSAAGWANKCVFASTGNMSGLVLAGDAPKGHTIDITDAGANVKARYSVADNEFYINTTTDAGNYKLQVAGNQYNSGFTKLGDAATGIKMKVVSGTTASTQGGSVTIAHGLTSSKILFITAEVFTDSATSFPPSFGHVTGCCYNIYADTSNITVFNCNGTFTSGSILSKPIKVIIFYTE